tara:strand:+ start:406 stop:906 length:501 start_codon:yes stop_codon:yes gene_type:complete
MKTNNIEYDLIKELFDYKDGNLFRRVRVSSRGMQGCIAGSRDVAGYIVVMINGINYKAHRLIWVWHFGDIPKDLQIDHINRQRDDNNIDNLRLVTNQENQFNRKGTKGYHWNRRDKKWQASIRIKGKKTNLGNYDKEEDAREAYLIAKKKYHNNLIEYVRHRVIIC